MSQPARTPMEIILNDAIVRAIGPIDELGDKERNHAADVLRRYADDLQPPAASYETAPIAKTVGQPRVGTITEDISGTLLRGTVVNIMAVHREGPGPNLYNISWTDSNGLRWAAVRADQIEVTE